LNSDIAITVNIQIEKEGADIIKIGGWDLSEVEAKFG